jgi:hypothetical protein
VTIPTWLPGEAGNQVAVFRVAVGDAKDMNLV